MVLDREVGSEGQSFLSTHGEVRHTLTLRCWEPRATRKEKLQIIFSRICDPSTLLLRIKSLSCVYKKEKSIYYHVATLDRFRRYGSGAMSRFRLLVIGRKDLFSPSIKDAWEKEGLDLLGPSDFTEAMEMLKVHGTTDGVLIDLAESAEHMVALVEYLEPLCIPFLFVAREAEQVSHYSPYELSAEKDDIDTIFLALMRQSDTATRH
ncbi:hypothetical protein [Allorhizobium terrae]|uniref:Uncharacterized protein n=1 Tax=Allorhizobium terrae TaxID=1848972 RepID=A0A4S3ZPB3_9HYPH|nr:hypothetical protein [Allorhizobium terrae]THF47327.1 hypothetical protein E6C51_17965 [Allorhizobium terrae]